MAIARARMTEDEFMRLPDDGRKYELVNGEAKEVPAGHKHGVIGANIIILLGPHARGRGFLAGSQAGFRMRDGNIRSPDVSFTLKSSLPGGEPSEGFEDFAPDLAIEIISTSEDRQEMADKVCEHFDAGAQQVWQLFPGTQHACVLNSPTDYQDLGPTDEIDGGDLLPTFHGRVSELFEVDV